MSFPIFLFGSVLLLLLILFFVGRKLGFRTALVIVLVVLVLELVVVSLRENAGAYQTPEEAFRAANSGLQAEDVVYGLDSALVLGQREGKVICSILDRTDKGWRVGDPLQTQTETLFLADGCAGTRHHKAGTADYYVEVEFPDGEEHEIADSCGSHFRQIALRDREDRYYAVLQDWPADYALSLDGREVELMALTEEGSAN